VPKKILYAISFKVFEERKSKEIYEPQGASCENAMISLARKFAGDNVSHLTSFEGWREGLLESLGHKEDEVVKFDEGN
jgi:hypothetical protein